MGESTPPHLSASSGDLPQVCGGTAGAGVLEGCLGARVSKVHNAGQTSTHHSPRPPAGIHLHFALPPDPDNIMGSEEFRHGCQ